jgi:hypothetical protein
MRTKYKKPGVRAGLLMMEQLQKKRGTRAFLYMSIFYSLFSPLSDTSYAVLT